MKLKYLSWGEIIVLSLFLIVTVAVPLAWAVLIAGGTNGQIQYNDGGTLAGATVGSGLNLSGGTLTATGVAGSITVGTTTISGGTNGDILYDNSGVIGELGTTGSGNVVRAVGPTITGSFTATGLVTNADLVNASTTVNGQTCTLGLTCTVTASAGSITVGTTTISSGTNGYVLYDNSGVLGNLSTLGSGSVFLTSDVNVAYLDVTDQTVSGGANVTSKSLSTGNVTIDCGGRQLQYITNGGAFTITAPSNDGNCIVLVTNNSSAGTISFSGFSVGSNTGDALDTTNTHKFSLFIWRVNSISGYRVAAHQ